MSKSEVKKVSRVKVKKKLWYRIIAPKLFGEKELGETFIASPESAIGRTLRVNLKEITGNIRDQNAYIGFRITRAEGSALHTAAIGYELNPGYVKRMVRKNTDRLDDYYSFTSKAGERVTLKTLMVTIHKTKRSVQATLRKHVGDFLRRELRKAEFSTFLGDVASYKIQSALKKQLNKIYPLKEIAIRVLKVHDREAARPLPPEEPEAVMADEGSEEQSEASQDEEIDSEAADDSSEDAEELTAQ